MSKVTRQLEMSSLFARSLSKRCISTSKSLWKNKVILGDPVEHATGLEKREMLARLAGNEDPYDITKQFKRGPGTRSEPNEIPSAFDRRLVGCVCEVESCSITWMWLHKGEPKRCECGYWFSLVHKAPL